MKSTGEAGYNERLFSGGIRKKLHQARFNWVAKNLEKLGCGTDSCLELGCFDGKVLDFLPNKPSRYLGLDANWEGGLDIAREKWKSETRFEFRQCTAPQEMGISGEKFDISICMETLEHVPPNMVIPYLQELFKATKKYLFITVPNEKGIVFALKFLTHRLLGRRTEKYTLAEFISAALGRTSKVSRGEHKGFDYDLLVKQVSGFFKVTEVSGIPFSFLPIWMNFGVGIIGKNDHLDNPSLLRNVSQCERDPLV
jgi:2-polyprenyl-3-methyl-5-hydroxy-6-metoxy-1,4-benzoquinol methylase